MRVRAKNSAIRENKYRLQGSPVISNGRSRTVNIRAVSSNDGVLISLLSQRLTGELIPSRYIFNRSKKTYMIENCNSNFNIDPLLYYPL